MRDLIARVACRHLCQQGLPCQCGGKCKGSVEGVKVDINHVEVDGDVDIEFESNLTQPLQTRRDYGSRYAWDEKIPGGLAEGKDPKDFDSKQLAKGRKVELEHTDDSDVATEIAMDHLTEDSVYYDMLEKIEKHASRVAQRYLSNDE